MSNWKDPVWRAAQLECEGHKCSYRCPGNGMLDEFVCTCGWSSGPYFDGSEWAEEAAQKHIAATRKLGPSTQARA